MPTPMPPLVGTAEIAVLLGVSRQRVLQLLDEGKGFPPPSQVLKMGNVWAEADVVEWAEKSGRLSVDKS